MSRFRPVWPNTDSARSAANRFRTKAITGSNCGRCPANCRSKVRVCGARNGGDPQSDLNDTKRAPRAMDVATAAGVSTATVSRTFNAPHKVAPAIRERVLAAAASLG